MVNLEIAPQHRRTKTWLSVKKSTLCAAQNQWLSFMKWSRRREWLLRLVMSRILNAQLFVGFVTWKRFCQHQERCEILLNKVLNKMCSNTLAMGWSAWVRYCRGLVEREERMEQLLVKTLSRFLNQTLAAALNQWRELIKRQDLLEQKGVKMAQVWKRAQNRELSAALNTFKTNNKACA